MLAENITAFVANLTYEKHLSAHTVTAYQADLEQFSKYLSDTYEVDQVSSVNHQLIKSWMVQLMDDGVSARSVVRKATTLRSFYKYLIREGVVQQNPMAKVIAPKAQKRLPVFVEERDIETLFDSGKNEDGEDVIDFGEGYEGARNRLVLLLFYSTGVRLSELRGLKVSDMNGYRQTIKVLGKRNKERIIPVPAELVNEVEHYLPLRNALGTENDWLFLTAKGEQMYPKLIYNIVKRFLSEVSSIEKRSPHVLRHTYATHLLNKGADLNAIKELLGHANLAATQIYTHNHIEHLKKMYKNKHPRA